MAAILWFSTGHFSAEQTGSILEAVLRWLGPVVTPAGTAALHLLVRKTAHLSVYAILAFLWYRALRRERVLSPGGAVAVALAVSVTWAIVDESHQAFVPSRTSSGWDVLIDACGATLALAVARRAAARGARPARPPGTRGAG